MHASMLSSKVHSLAVNLFFMLVVDTVRQHVVAALLRFVAFEPEMLLRL
jgi:hypothetical protein